MEICFITGGVTTAQILPGSSNLMGGEAITVKTLDSHDVTDLVCFCWQVHTVVLFSRRIITHDTKLKSFLDELSDVSVLCFVLCSFP